MTKRLLGQFEELVMRAILCHDNAAIGLQICSLIESRTNQSASVGAVYKTLERLESGGFLNSAQTEPVPIQGGRRKRYFAVNQNGITLLRQAEFDRKALTPTKLTL